MTVSDSKKSGSIGTVHLVDDDPAVLSGLRWLFESEPWRVETYESGDLFLGRYDGEGPACLVLDLVMPGMGGLALQRELLARGWTLPIIFLSGQGRVADAVQALRDGATDFLEKPFRTEEICERIRTALAKDGERRLRMVADDERKRQIAALTKREQEVATRVAAGLANKVIAMELGISARTVEVYRAHAMRKVGARSVADLVRVFLADGPTREKDPARPAGNAEDHEGS